MASEGRLRELEERYEGYTVYDNRGEKIGKVDDLFVDETDREEYIGVKMGLFGLQGETLIPMEIARVNERERTIEVAESKDHVKDAPTFRDDDDVTSEYEDRIRRHFGLETPEPSEERGTYGRDTGAGATPSGGMRDLETGERGRMGDEGYREAGGREDLSSSGAPTAGPGEARPTGGTEGLQAGDPGRMEDEGYREGYREGFREGLREGLREAGVSRGEVGDRGDLDSPGTTTGAGATEEGTPRRDIGGPGDEGYRDRGAEGTAERPSDEGGREESELTRVWRRIRR